MATLNSANGSYQNSNKTLFEVQMLATSNGTVINNSNPLPVTAITNINGTESLPWDVQVSRGKVPGVTQINVFGYSNSVSNTAWTTLWEDGVYTFPTVTQTMNLFSSSASDVGANVLISGLDANYNMISETLTLNGTANVTTTKQFFRVNSMQLTSPPASNASNIGVITLKNAANVAMIYPQVGRMQNGWYSIPAGYSLYIRNINIFSGETKSGATPTWFYYRVRNHNNITGTHYNVLTTSFQNEYKVQRSNPVRYTEKSDIEWQFQSSDSGPHTMGIILEALLISDTAP